MKKIKYLLPLAILISCNTQKNVTADYEINKNEVLEISLKSNPSTGYSWKWIKNQSSSLLDSVSSTYVATKVKEGIVGSGGNEVWKFKALESGIDTLKLEYQRSWEKNSTVETKKIIVKIN